MPRLASLFLPFLATDRIRRSEAQPGVDRTGSSAPPDLRFPDGAPCLDEPAPASARSCPRAPGFRPGARWAQPSIRDEARAASPDAAGLAALVTAERSSQQVRLASVCAEARALGLVPGMALTQARILAPGLDVRDADPEGDLAWLQRLGDFAASRWTPRAALAAPDGLWLDLSGVAHLFGGEENMGRRILAFCARLGFSARIAMAGTFGAAHALARFGKRDLIVCAGGSESDALAVLPVAALRLDEAQLAIARRLGLETIGDLAGLPRAPLQRRFGPDLLDRLDQALGRKPEPFDPIVPAAPPQVMLRFVEPISTAEAIAEAMREALSRLVADLGRRGLAARALRLESERVDGEIVAVAIGTARATREAAHLQGLLAARIEEIDPGFGIERMRLVAARVERLGAQPIAGMLAAEGRSPDLVPLIDRLAGRLGARRLYRSSAVESDIPERSLTRVGPLDPVRAWPDWPRPVRLLSPPEPIGDVMALLPDQPPRRFSWRGRTYRVRQADGPERIHGEWWKHGSERAAVRDYFQVEDEAGHRFWLFRRGDGVEPTTGDLSWYMHGLFA